MEPLAAIARISCEQLESRVMLAAHASLLSPALWSFALPATVSAQAASAPGDGAAGAQAILTDAAGRIGIRITASDVNGLLPKLQEVGFVATGVAADLHIVEGFIDSDHLLALAGFQADGLLGVIPIYRPEFHVGSADNQADFVHEADRVRAQLAGLGIDGSGMSIGVLSDSYNSLGGEAADISSGDLPNDVTVLQDFTGSDEGRAMLQLIHDIAPGAALGFATAFTGQIGFANNIRDLARNAGFMADIIVDDVVYFTAPFFQDGVIAQAVTEVFNTDGVAYFSSTGNAADFAYESTSINFSADSDGLLNGSFHDFDPETGVDTRQALPSLANGQRIRFSLQWDDPFYTVAGVDTDLDISLVIAGTNTVVASASDNNLANQTPLEFLDYTNSSGATQNLELVIELAAGLAPGRIKYLDIAERGVLEFDTNSPTVFGHKAAPGGMPVAAVPYYDQDTPESFTSEGPTTILFDPAGNRLISPEVRDTPRIAAIDGVNTSFFGSTDYESDGFPNFFGTSAAAPNAAAVAALILDANPSYSAQDVYDRLEQTATDIGAAGFDNLTGFGLINAYDAINGPAAPMSINYSESFESGFLDGAWETNFTNGGRAHVTDAGGAQTGTQSLLLASNLTSSTQGTSLLERSEAVLHLDLQDFSSVELAFYVRETGDEDNAMSPNFVGSEDSDGVALSVDGTNWFRLISLTGTNSTESFQQHIFDLSAFAAANSLTLGTDTRIKFQQFDNFPTPSDGIFFDDLVVTGIPLSVPQVVGSSVNDGDVNRSGIRELTVTFMDPVTLASAMSLNVFNHTTQQSVDLSAATLMNNGTTSVTWDLTGLSLDDGRYTAELPRAATTPNLAHTHTFEFSKLAGDVNGNDVVSFSDYTAVNANFAASVDPFGPGDANGNGVVSFSDYTAVNAHFANSVDPLEFDFGDAPDSATFPTTLANDGARHVVTGNSLFLGTLRDAESDGHSSGDATGDDVDNAVDEDGVSVGSLVVGTDVDVTVTADVPTAAVLNGWVDFNQDGDWDDAGEYVFADEPLSDGSNSLSLAVPSEAITGMTFARFRITATAGYSYFGLAAHGEVEDYELNVTNPPAAPPMLESLSAQTFSTSQPPTLQQPHTLDSRALSRLSLFTTFTPPVTETFPVTDTAESEPVSLSDLTGATAPQQPNLVTEPTVPLMTITGIVLRGEPL